MSFITSKLINALLFCSLRVYGYATDDQVGASIDYGTFDNPSSYVRPRFRYWIPDASVNLSVVADDFAYIKEAGLGGVELLGYYLYGNYPSVISEGGPTPVDWTQYGWATKAWKDLMDVALRATKDNGLIIDFTNVSQSDGPTEKGDSWQRQPRCVPAEADDEGLMWNLMPFNVSVPLGGSFDSILPGWGAGDFVSASTALVTRSKNVTQEALPAWQGPYEYEGTDEVLAASSLEDVTDQVGEDGRISLDFPPSTNGLHYQVFAYYQNHPLYMEQASPLIVNASVPQSPIESFVQNGSFVVDHFSATGAQVIIDFWEDYLLDDDTRALIQEVGNYAWEDSYEFGAGAFVWWTPQVLNAFRRSRGYGLNKYLPLIYTYQTEANGLLASPNHFYTDEEDGGWSHVTDYWQTLTELNAIYLQTLTNWTATSLNSQFSTQVAYNLPMDMLENIPYVNAPECESLGFDHVIDAYRQFTGAANLAGKRVISNELGAQRDEVYSQTMPELIWDVKRAIVGSVNQMVYHGYAFSGEYPNTTWPGYTTFTYRFSNMHGPRQPSWEHYRDFMDWTARMQFVAQSGIPKIDLAFWLKRNEFYEVAKSVYEPNDLAEAGFSYEYLDPANLILPEAYVQDGILAPARQAFKVMVVRGNDSLTVSGIQRLVELANDGLPIIFSGGLPQNLTGYNVSGTEYVQTTLSSLIDLDNVHIVPYENLAASMSSLGITPRTSVNAERIWYTHFRQDELASATYIFVYNDGWDVELGEGASTGSVTFETVGVPYTYDAWTGDINPILAYQQTETTTTIPMSLAGNQSVIVAFHQNEVAPTGTRLLSLPSSVVSAQRGDIDAISIKASRSTSPVILSNGTSLSLPIPAPIIPLTDWTLVVESWTSPEDPEAQQTIAAKSNSTHQISGKLEPWNHVTDSLRDVSGRGFYTTTFTWPPENSREADGAVIDLGALTNTARVWVNGQPLPPLDCTDAKADIGDYLMEGDNEVEIVVTTTLGNALRPIYQDIKSSGTLWLGPEPIEQEYGLVMPVTVVPYRTTLVQL